MADKLALKKLTRSDLTFFEWQFRNQTEKKSNQKAINLNADVFVDELYPSAPAIAPTMDDQIPLALNLFGPGLKDRYSLARKIIKAGSYKNWRLNGEFIYNPDGDASRFNILAEGDLAVMAFKGDPLPTGIDLILISANVGEDALLHRELARLLPSGRRSMISLRREDLQVAVRTAGIPEGHPIQSLLADPELVGAIEDAAYGEESATRIVRRRAGRRVSHADLMRARINAERIGRDGEGLVRHMLRLMEATGELTNVVWASDSNAVAPFDFSVTTVAGENIKIDAKSTEGEFSRTIHISAAEIVEAANAERYDLYRVYELNGEGAKVRIAENIGAFARDVVAAINALPRGVRPDGFSVDPSVLTWGPEKEIVRPEEPDAEE